MAPKHHPTPLSGGDRKALNKELGKSRAMTNILAAQSAEMRAKAETMLQQADRLLCESWNERMGSDGDRSRKRTRSGGAQLAQRDTPKFGGATEPQREAGPQRGTAVHIQSHPVDVVTARDKPGI